MPVGDIYEVVFAGQTNEDERWNNVTHWELVTDVGGSLYDTAEGLAEELATAFAAGPLTVMSEGWTLTDTRANRVFPSIGVPYATGTGAGLGGVVGESLPADVAAVITKRTDQPGAKFRGRLFQGGITESQNENGQLPFLAAQQFVNLWNDVFNSADPDGIGNLWIPVVFSRKAVADGDPVVSAGITRIQIDRILRNMRPRSTKVATYVNPAQP